MLPVQLAAALLMAIAVPAAAAQVAINVILRLALDTPASLKNNNKLRQWRESLLSIVSFTQFSRHFCYSTFYFPIASATKIILFDYFLKLFHL